MRCIMNKIDFIMFALDNSDWNTFRILANILNPTEIAQLAKRVIKTKNAENIYLFACDINHAPILELARAIVETGDAKYIYLFAHYIEGSPIKKLSSIDEYQNAIYKHIKLVETTTEDELEALKKIQQWIKDDRMDSIELFINSLSDPSVTEQLKVK